MRARSEAGGGWLGWVVQVDDISEQESRLGRESVVGNRHRPDGVELRWRQLGVKGLQADPQLPFFIEWEQGVPHPSDDANTEVTIDSLQIAGDPDRVRDWLGLPADNTSSVIDFTFVSPHGTPGPHGGHLRHPERRGHHLTGRSLRRVRCTPDHRRSRRLFVTTSTLDSAIAPPAIIGSSRPAIASGMAATL